MIVYGFAKGHRYREDGQLEIQTRIPNIHGPYDMSSYQGKQVKNYTSDENLPWYPSLLLTRLPCDGEVVVLLSDSSTNPNFLVIGLTGGGYNA